MTRTHSVLASLGGIGFLPRGPATVASLAGAGALALVRPTRNAHALMVVAAALATQRCAAQLATPEDPDPRYVVVDELAGVWLTLLGGPLSSVRCLAGAVLFRVLDRWKPWPIGLVHRRMGHTAVLADDLVAGMLANGALRAGSALFDRARA
jgi:phosphatidylglycerophosphatase A